MFKAQKTSVKTDKSVLLIDQQPWYARCDASYHLFLRKNLNRFYDLILSPNDFSQMVTRTLIPQIVDLPIDFIVVPLMAGAMLCSTLEKSLSKTKDTPVITIPFSRHPVVTFSKDDAFIQRRSLMKYQEYAKSFPRQLKGLVDTRFTKRNGLNILFVDVAHNEGDVSFLVESLIRRILGGHNIRFYFSCVINEMGRNPRLSPNGRVKKTIPEYYVIKSQNIIRKSSHLFFLLTPNDREANFTVNTNRNFPECYYLWRYLDQTVSQSIFEAYVCPRFFKHELAFEIDKNAYELTGFLDEWRSWELESRPLKERVRKYFCFPKIVSY